MLVQALAWTNITSAYLSLALAVVGLLTNNFFLALSTLFVGENTNKGGDGETNTPSVACVSDQPLPCKQQFIVIG